MSLLRAHSISLSAVLIGCSLACSERVHGPDSLPEPLAICDGSDGIRFGHDSAGGRSHDRYEGFFQRYGRSFIYVRGDCHSIAGGYAQLREGELSPQQAERLSIEVDYRTIDRRAREEPDFCHDAPTERIHGPNATWYCKCCGNWTGSVLSRLNLDSRPVPVDVTVATMRYEFEPIPNFPAWPLDTPIDAFAAEHGGIPGVEDGVRIDDPSDISALVALREAGHSDSGEAPVFQVLDSAGVAYRVFVRDELPPDMETLVQKLLVERARR